MARRKGKQSKWWDRMSMMPPTAHNIPKDQPFDIMQSDVAEWLISQPEVRQMIFDKAGIYGAITYDAKTGKWVGVNYEV